MGKTYVPSLQLSSHLPAEAYIYWSGPTGRVLREIVNNYLYITSWVLSTFPINNLSLQIAFILIV